jgi:hypothetical protein
MRSATQSSSNAVNKLKRSEKPLVRFLFGLLLRLRWSGSGSGRQKSLFNRLSYRGNDNKNWNGNDSNNLHDRDSSNKKKKKQWTLWLAY